MPSLAIILGTRAEFLKCVPLLQYLQRTETEHKVLHTGQNEIEDLVHDFGIRHENLIELKSFQGVSLDLLKGLRRSPALVAEIRHVLGDIDARYVVFHGDTATTFAAAIASIGQKCPTAHIEAGLRSHSMLEPFPEEFFRTVADRKSSVLFAPSRMAEKNLLQERIKGEVVLTGNTICDMLNMIVKRIGEVRREQFVLMTSHRYENILIKPRLRRILEILELCRYPVYWPLHRMTRVQLERFGLMEQIKKNENIHILPPASYTEFVRLLLRCNYVITDGGGIEEESIILGKPCLLLRKRTERGEGLGMGITFLSRLDPKYSESVIRMLEAGYVPSETLVNPYVVDGSPTELIGQFLQAKLTP